MKNNTTMQYLTIVSLLIFQISLSQNLKIYFNQSVNNSISSITDAKNVLNIDDTICAYINRATTSIDFAVYNNNSTKIAIAINNAHSRGVVIRYITNTSNTNSALNLLNVGIPVLKRNNILSRNQMHNKFLIIDANTLNYNLITGSMNFTDDSMLDDFNNILFIKNQSIVDNYKLEFNEMWGGSQILPNNTNSKFGPDKLDNTLHIFNVDTVPVEVYFAPTDNIEQKVLNAINSAQSTLDFAMLSFNVASIRNAIISAKNRGVVVRGIIENTISFGPVGSEYMNLLNGGIEVYTHINIPNVFHHKYCIIDAQTNQAKVITGSLNWSQTALDDYDDNMLIIKDKAIAQQYLEEFSMRLAEVGAIVHINDEANLMYNFYPNPTQDILNFNACIENVAVFNLLGQKINLPFNGQKIDLSHQEKGVYIVIIELDGKEIIKKIVLE